LRRAVTSHTGAIQSAFSNTCCQKPPTLRRCTIIFGVAYCELGRYQDAIDEYKQAIRIKPDYAEVYDNLGDVYGKLGRWQEAIESYKQAVRIKRIYPVHTIILAMLTTALAAIKMR